MTVAIEPDVLTIMAALKEARLRAQLTHAELARDLGMGAGYVASAEAGQIGVSPDYIRRVFARCYPEVDMDVGA